MSFDLPPKLYLPPKPAIIRPDTGIEKANFLPGMFPGGVVAAPAAGGVVITDLDLVTSTTEASSIDYGTVDFGPVITNREILVVVQWLDAGAPLAVNGGTIGGVAISLVETTGIEFAGVAIVRATIPSGTSGNITLTYTDNVLESSVAVYSMTGHGSTTATDSADVTVYKESSASVGIDVPEGGAILAGATNVFGSSFTWTGITEDIDFNIGKTRISTGHDNGLSEETARTIDAASSSFLISLAAASWGP